MTVPISFATASPRLDLPFLFVGQAQKEVFVNEALARLDALVQPVVKGQANTPAPTPAEGDCWLVGTAPTGAWAGKANALASYQGGAWLFADAAMGMLVFDQSAGQYAHFDGQWRKAAAVPAPSGGATVDAAARTAIQGLIAALIAVGILP